MNKGHVTSVTDSEVTTNTDLAALATAIDNLRDQLGVSYRALAEDVGIDHARLYRMLRYGQSTNAYALGQSMAALGRIVERHS